MEITDSSKVYLNNFDVLEQTRKETLNYLEQITLRVMDTIDDYAKTHKKIKVESNKTKGSSDVNFSIPNVPGRKLGKDANGNSPTFLYRIFYKDCSSNDTNTASKLTSSLNCIVYGFTAQTSKKLKVDIERTAKEKDIEDPYEEKQFGLLDQSFDETISAVSEFIIAKLDNMEEILETLLERESNSQASS